MNRKKSQAFQRKSQNVLRHQKVNRLKQLGFTTSWNINQQKKDYNALQDPHADRYFRYQSVKMHMKQLKRSIAKSEKSDLQKKKITLLIKQKLSDHLPAIKVAAQTYNIPTDQLDKSKVSQKLNKQKSFTQIGKLQKRYKKKKNKHTDQNQIDFSLNYPVNNLNQQSKNNEQNEAKHKSRTANNTRQNSQSLLRQEDKNETDKKQYLKQQQQLMHRKKHEEFIAFIAKKRQNLSSVNSSVNQVP